MALDIASALQSARNPADAARLLRTNPLHFTTQGLSGALGSDEASPTSTFERALLQAMDGVNASQGASTDIVQQMLVDPDSVDVQDVTLAMSEANLSLNLAKTILTRVVSAWRDIINTR
jgi:flagellar hook-basal body complex protein FliE